MIVNGNFGGDIVIARRIKFFAVDLFGRGEKFAKRGDYRVSRHSSNGKTESILVSQSDFFKYYPQE